MKQWLKRLLAAGLAVMLLVALAACGGKGDGDKDGDVINAVEYARSKNANVVALTDSPASPIAMYASQLLTAHSDMASFVDSLVAPLSIINAMIVAVARKKQDDLTERLRALEDVWDRYDVYDKKGV